LVGELGVVILEEAIHKDSEFAPQGGVGDQRIHSSGAQAQEKPFQDAVMAHGAQGGHAEGETDAGICPSFIQPTAIILRIEMRPSH
jgi:hypothetical protein